MYYKIQQVSAIIYHHISAALISVTVPENNRVAAVIYLE
jgi:hypothetical protein